jgi:formamidopyrimidine-DNA glycosylase
MPELPEVEATRARIEPALKRKRIRAVEVLRADSLVGQRPGEFAALVTGRTIREVRRRGKNLLIDLSGGLTIRIHFRMTGGLLIERKPAITPRVRATFELSSGDALLFVDSRALGKMYAAPTARIEAQLDRALGPEPLSREFRLEPFVETARASRLPSKLWLMDQKRVAGLGNIYAAEALWRAQIDPRQPMREVPIAKLGGLYSAIRSVLREAVKSARLAYKRPGPFQEGEFARAVYAREGEACPRCGRRIRRIEQGGRSTFFCSQCQRSR